MERFGEKVMGLGVARFQNERPSEIIRRFDRLIVTQSQDAEIVKGALVLGVEPEGGLVTGLRSRRVTLGEAKIAECEISFRVVRDQGVGTLEMVFGQRQVVCLEREATRVIGF